MVHVGMMIRLIHLGDGELVQRQRGSTGHVVEGVQESRGRRQTRGGVEKSAGLQRFDPRSGPMQAIPSPELTRLRSGERRNPPGE